MKIRICNLLVVLTIILNYVESSPMPAGNPPNRPIRPFWNLPPLPPPPAQPMQRYQHNPRAPPELLYDEGQIVGVWFNGRFQNVVDVVIPAPTPVDEPLHGPYPLPDGAIVYTNRREPCGIVRGQEIYGMHGSGIVRPGPLYYAEHRGALIAACRNHGFITFRLLHHNNGNI